MSSWSEIRARSGDVLADTINSLLGRANLQEAVTEQITISDKISPLRILRSKIEVTDEGFTTAVVKDRIPGKLYFMPFEPDGRVLRLDLKFDHGGTSLYDHSMIGGNEVEIVGDVTEPVLIKGSYDDGVTSGKISSICDGLQHYYKGKVTPKISIKQLVAGGFPGFSFIYRFFSLSTLNEQRSEGSARATPIDFIENDQVQYGVKLEIDDAGRVYYYVRFNYQDYYLETPDPIVPITSNIPNYFAPDYDMDNYDADTEQFQIIYPIEYMDLGVTFDFATKKMQIYKNGLLIAESIPPATIPALANLSMWLPLNEGGGETLHDISGLNNNGSFSTVIAARKPTWDISGNRRSLKLDDRDYAIIPSHTTLRNMTSWTLSFFMFLRSDYYTINHSKIIYKHGSGNGSFLVYTAALTGRSINIDLITQGGTTRFLSTGGTPLPLQSEYAHIVITYDGTNYKIYVNKTLVYTSASFVGDQITNTNDLNIGYSTDNLSPSANYYHLMLWKNTALDQTQIDTIYDELFPTTQDITTYNDQPVFPPGYDEPPPPPAPGTPVQQPFEKVMDQNTENSSAKINKQTVSGLTTVYNVAKGAEELDPFVPVYNVPAGIQTDTTTTSPVSTVYDADGESSHGSIDGDKFFYGQRIKNTGSNYYGKIVTDVTINVDPNGCDGPAKIGIMTNTGTFIQFGTDFNIEDKDTDEAVRMTNYTHGHTMAVGDAIGLYFVGEDGVQVQRANPVDGSDSCQSRWNGSSWQDNTSFHMAGIFKDGGIVTGAIQVEYVELQNVSGQRYQVGNLFTTSAANLNKTITKIELYVWRDSTIGPGTPTIQLLHLNSSGTIKTGGTLLSVNVSTLPTSKPATPNFVWENGLYANPLLLNERIIVQTTGLTTGKVKVLFNNGANSGSQNHDTTRSYLVYRNHGSTGSSGWSTSSTLDMSGKMYTGGNDFIPYIRLDHATKRAGIKCVTSSSDLIGLKITKVQVTANEDNNATEMAMYCRIRSAAGAERVTLNQVDSSNVGDVDTMIEFVKTDNTYALALGDIISIEYEGGTATDYIKLAINKNQYDAANTMLAITPAGGTVGLAQTDRDLAATLYTGGTLDTAARPKRGIKFNNNAACQGKAISEARIKLKRTGTFDPADKVFVRIIRWTDKVSVITLGEKLCNDISAAGFVEYIFQNTGNAYALAVGDLLSIECNFGNSVNKFIEIRMSSTNVYDSTFTTMFEYNGQTYDEVVGNDLTAELYIGGFMVFPDPTIPLPPNPYHHYHGYHFNAALPPDSGGIIDPDLLKPKTNTYFNVISDQLKLYAAVLIQDQFINFFNNKITTSAIGFGETEVVGYDFVPYDND